jgi:hypothetical protein
MRTHTHQAATAKNDYFYFHKHDMENIYDHARVHASGTRFQYCSMWHMSTSRYWSRVYILESHGIKAMCTFFRNLLCIHAT